MNKLINGSKTHLSKIEQQSQMNATGKQAGQYPANSPEVMAWGEKIMRNMKRMFEDESYRMEIAKDLS